MHGSKSVYYYVDWWCLCFAPGLITQIGAAGLDECMPWWYMAMMGVHPSFRFRLLCRVKLTRGALCCSLKSHSDGVGCVAEFALAVPMVTGRGENFGVRVRHGRGSISCADRSTDEARFRRVQ